MSESSVEASATPVCAFIDDARAAAEEHGKQMAALEKSCADRLARGPCDASRFVDIATRYQRCYGERENPDRFEGRIDALSRQSEPGLTPDDLSVRMAGACEERCSTARRLATAQARGEAAEFCAKRPDVGRKFCGERARIVVAEDRKGFLADCLEECEASRKAHQAEVAREQNRPRTRAQSLACFRGCMSECTGGRIVPAADGTYRKDPDDWCGTCEFTCDVSCAVR